GVQTCALPISSPTLAAVICLDDARPVPARERRGDGGGAEQVRVDDIRTNTRDERRQLADLIATSPRLSLDGLRLDRDIREVGGERVEERRGGGEGQPGLAGVEHGGERGDELLGPAAHGRRWGGEGRT